MPDNPKAPETKDIVITVSSKLYGQIESAAEAEYKSVEAYATNAISDKLRGIATMAAPSNGNGHSKAARPSPEEVSGDLDLAAFDEFAIWLDNNYHHEACRELATIVRSFVDNVNMPAAQTASGNGRVRSR